MYYVTGFENTSQANPLRTYMKTNMPSLLLNITISIIFNTIVITIATIAAVKKSIIMYQTNILFLKRSEDKVPIFDSTGS